MSSVNRPCPKCGARHTRNLNNGIHWCGRCAMPFDDEPDEGGDYSDHNPAARLERDERRRERRRRRT